MMPVNYGHCFVLQGDFTCGGNSNGQLGTGDQEDRITFTPVNLPQGFLSVCAGDEDHNVGVAEDGTLWGWGRNSVGQLGLGPNQFANQCVPTQIPNTPEFRPSCCWKSVHIGT